MSRIQLDQNAPRGLRKYLPGHRIETAAQRGWATLENGQLLRAAEEAGFDFLITADQNIRYQQNLSGRAIGLIIIGTNRWNIIRNDLQRIVQAVAMPRPGAVVVIDYV